MTGTESPRADLLDLAYPYAMDAVAEIERRRIENRLAKADSGTAAAFAAGVHGIRETLAALSATAAVNPPPTLESKILRAIDDSRPCARRRRGDLREILVRRRLARLVMAAAVTVAAGAGAVVVAERVAGSHAAAVTADQILGQPDAYSRVIDLSVGGTLTVSTSDRLGAVAVIFDAVPAPPRGRAYQLWVVSAGAVRSAGVLTGVPPTGVATRFDPADVIAVTLEPAKGSPRPTSPQIAAVTLG
ncbi:anti-sigma factor domain-containing protein [Nocardia sp. NPDC057455]|uniref:anti-sigma factor n=1 Tax=Nocardia sp. NPDC057455 TaxID=3346138 RepID=UPI00366C88AB